MRKLNEAFSSRKLADMAKQHGGIEISINGGMRNGTNAFHGGSSVDVSKITDDTKNSRTDLTILLKEEKTLVNVEAYTSFSLESLKKSNLYILRGYSSQLKKGHKYQAMNPFIQIKWPDYSRIYPVLPVKNHFTARNFYPSMFFAHFHPQ